MAIDSVRRSQTEKMIQSYSKIRYDMGNVERLIVI
jgi:hypothetical protein